MRAIKTTLGELRVKGVHPGTGTVFLLADNGSEYSKPHGSDKIYAGQFRAGERVFRCHGCRKDLPVAKALAYSPDKSGSELEGWCVGCAKTNGLYEAWQAG